jgi:hypothetical protein
MSSNRKANGHGSPDFASIKAASMSKIEWLVFKWLQHGKQVGNEWVATNPTRNDTRPGSFKINLITGVWSDFATDDTGGDMIDLYAYLKGLSILEAAKDVGDLLGVRLLTRDTYSAPPVRVTKPSGVLPPSQLARNPESFPSWTPTDKDGKPRFLLGGLDLGPPRHSNETRRHVYKVGAAAVQIKIMLAGNAGAVNWYCVTDNLGLTGWQIRKPEGFKNVPFIGAIDPFDPDILDSDESLRPLYWPEGEKDTDTVSGKGELAFTFGGVGDGLPAGCEEYVRGRHIVILADNDQPGKKHANEKAELAAPVALSVKVIHFPELKHKGDVTDFFEGGGTLAELQHRVAVQAPYSSSLAVPSSTELVQASTDLVVAPQTHLTTIRATPYVWTEPETIPLRAWLYGRHLLRKFVSATVAPGAVGKSSLILAEALAMVSGRPLLGISPTQKLRVWLWNLEDPKEETVRRVQATAKFYNLGPGDFGDRLFVDSGRDQSLVIATTRNGASIVLPVVENIISEIMSREIDVLSIDPFVSCHMVSENDNQAMDMVVKEWAKVADRTNCAIELVHHTRKQGGTEVEVTTESARGAKALTDACRSVRAVNRMTKEEGEKAGVENHRSHFRLFEDKPNLAPPADKSDWFELKSVNLGNGGGVFGDSIGVVTVWQWPDHFADVSVGDLRQVQAKVAEGRWRESSQSPAWVGHAVAAALRLETADKRQKAKISGLLKVWIQNGALKIVEGKDEKGTARSFVEVGKWAVD